MGVQNPSGKPLTLHQVGIIVAVNVALDDAEARVKHELMLCQDGKDAFQKGRESGLKTAIMLIQQGRA